MKIIFLGCGYLGSNLAYYLKEKYDVSLWGLVSPYSNVDYFKEVDIFDIDHINKEELKDSVVIDTLSLFPFDLKVDNQQEYLQQFNDKYLIILNLLKSADIRQYIYLSSGGSVYGNCQQACKEDFPLNGSSINLYSASKVMLEKTIQDCDLPYTIVRLSNPYGGYQLTNRRQGVIPVLIENGILHKQFQCWASLEAKRDYIYISDVANALSLLIDNKQIKQIYNVGSGDSISLISLIQTIEKVCNINIDIQEIKREITIVQDSLLDISKLENNTGFKPLISLEEGIKKEYERISKELK